MGDNERGELKFRKRCIDVPNDPPPAQVADKHAVRAARRRRKRSFTRHCFRLVSGLFLFIAVLTGGAVLALESGTLDRVISSTAQSALNSAMAPRYQVAIGSSVIRFTSSFDLAIEARDVTLTEATNGEQVSRTGAVRLALDPKALFSGRVAVSDIEAEGISLDSKLWAGGEPLDFSKLRIDGIPSRLETGFVWLDEALDFMRRSGTDSLKLDGVELALRGGDGVVRPLGLEGVRLQGDGEGTLSLSGAMTYEGETTDFIIGAEHRDGRTRSLSASMDRVELGPLLLRHDKSGNIRQGFEGAVDVTLKASRGIDNVEPTIGARIATRNGKVYFDAVSQDVGRADIELGYDFTKSTIELLPSEVELGPMKVPFSGGLIDLNRLEPDAGAGIGIDFLVSEGWADAPGAGEAPFPFSVKVFGRYTYDDRLLEVSELIANTPSGSLNGKLRIDMANPSPEIRFDAEIPQMQTGMVKQLWPYWMAARPRQWVFANMFGGTVRNARINVFIPSGRLSVEPVPLELRGDELSLVFDMEDTRVNIAGDLPAVRDTSGRLELHGEELKVTLKGGTSYFGNNRSVKVEKGEIGIASTYTKPLMADIKVSVSGQANAVGEFVSYKPINALERVGFSAEDLSGRVKADAEVRLGLIRAQNPPDPVWKVGIDLDDVALAKEFDGRKISKLHGRLDVDPQAARLDGKGEVDGMPMEVKLTEPIEQNSTVKRERVVKLKVEEKQIGSFAPGLEDIAGGTLDLEVTRLDEKRQAVVADLNGASLTVPWVGWNKGAGVGAKAEFVIEQVEGGTRIDKFSLKGDGFGAAGEMLMNRTGLASASFGRVQLSPADDFALSISQNKGAYLIKVNGKSADVRSIVGKLKGSGSGAAAGSGGGAKAADDNFSGRIEASLEAALGFNDEAMRNVTLRYVARGGKTTAVDLSAISRDGQAVVGQMRSEDGASSASLTSSDAGAIARFADLYGHIRGGMINLRLDGTTDGPWAGSLDIRNFRLENEQRLQSMVSTPTGADGRSLNKAVKRDIDVSSEKFQRAFARLVYHDSALRIDNGVVRGEQIGATFQGMVRDANGNMDLTGTFMPAYGLNRLFAELPVIGIILGNGRDRGLLGITFKLSGPVAKPKLLINPLSLIAPGVFRQIFEFQ